jgi:hypothetical protein
MLDFHTFCYLENQKTGSSFVEAFLRAFSRESIKAYVKHQPAPAREAGKFYFLNVRNPLDTYLSLFNFGRDGRGELHRRAQRLGFGDLYDPRRGSEAFDLWLHSLLDPSVVGRIYSGYRPVLEQAGLMSMRFLLLATFEFRYAVPMVQRVLRFESLRADLAETVERHLAHAIIDCGAALQWIAATPPINASQRREEKEPLVIRRRTIRALLAREAPLYGRVYADSREELQRLAAGETGSVMNMTVCD